MTDRSSEERSRFENDEHRKFAAWFAKEFDDDGCPCNNCEGCELRSATRDGWIGRATLEDRQEAAPEVGLRIDNLINYAANLQSDTIYLDPDDIAFIHEYYGCKTGCCTKFAGKIMRPKVGAVPGVPSEATPSKENAPPEWPTLPAPDPFDAGFQAGLELGKYQAAPAEVPTPPKPLLLCNLCGLRRDEHIDTDHRFLDARTAPAPEVQGTPAKECICPTETWTVDGSDMHDSMCEIDHDSPVGTPQKETPPMKDAAKVRVAQYEARIPCGNCGHVHLGRCSVCDPPGCEQIVPPTVPAPEGVQGKEPQTPEFTCPECDSNCCITAGGSKLVCYHCHLAKVERAIGEAAGRRSAITEIKEWARCRRQPTDAASMDWDAAYADALDAVITWCAELQEKTKP